MIAFITKACCCEVGDRRNKKDECPKTMDAAQVGGPSVCRLNNLSFVLYI